MLELMTELQLIILYILKSIINWKGINVEPIKAVYDKLEQNRPSCINFL